MADITPQQCFDNMTSRFKPERAKGVNAVIQFKLSGESGGDWNISVADETIAVNQGVAPSPKVTISMTDADFVNLITGKANGMQLFMTGKIKLQGDLMLANAMMSWFQM